MSDLPISLRFTHCTAPPSAWFGAMKKRSVTMTRLPFSRTSHKVYKFRKEEYAKPTVDLLNKRMKGM